ncbi:hypothetical protein CN934_09595 [Ensifer sp. MMN_5]|nr:hypothetical protein CN934_09595 [Ensifer sp. MMN_5]PND28996.1 hypothetical protein CN933_02710 [Sinorhizobium sp. M4_45]
MEVLPVAPEGHEHSPIFKSIFLTYFASAVACAVTAIVQLQTFRYARWKWEALERAAYGIEHTGS